MTIECTKKFINALKEAGITNYQFDSDLGTHMYNSSNAVLYLDEPEETMYNFTRRIPKYNTPYGDGNILVYSAHVSDLHEARVAGSYEQIKAFIDAYGMNLSEDQLKIILNIDKKSYNINPMTGDYFNFKFLSADEYNSLSEEEKEKYDEDYKKYKLQHDDVKKSNISAHITIG